MRLLWQRLEAKKHDDDDPPKRGRGSKQQKVIGALARGGLVVAKPVEKVNSKTLKASLSDVIKADDSVLITDEYEGYSRMNEWAPHFTISHAVAYAQGLVHTNSLEGFWSLVKRAVYGSHHHYNKAHAASYLVEACWKFNNRRNPGAFEYFIAGAMTV